MLLEAIIAEKIKKQQEAEAASENSVLRLPLEPLPVAPAPEKGPTPSKIIEIDLA